MSESAVSAKQFCFMFGAKPAQSETPVRAAAKRRSTRKRPQWNEAAKLPRGKIEKGRNGAKKVGRSRKLSCEVYSWAR